MVSLVRATAVVSGRWATGLWVWAAIAGCGAGGTSVSAGEDEGRPQTVLGRPTDRGAWPEASSPQSSPAAIEGTLEWQQAPKDRLALEPLSAVLTLRGAQEQKSMSGLRVERARLVMDCCGSVAPTTPNAHQEDPASAGWAITQVIAPRSGRWRLSLACLDAADQAFELNFIFRAR